MSRATVRQGAWTRRQREVLDLLADGYSNREIAERLGISLDGAKWHVSEILGELGVPSREDAAEYWRAERRPRAGLARAVLLVAGVGAAAAVAVVVVAVAVSAMRGRDDAPAAPDATPVPPGTAAPPTTPLPRGVFLPVGPMATRRSLHTSVALPDGSVLIMGGNASGVGGDPVLGSVERFRPRTLTFEPAGSLAVRRQACSATLLEDGTVLVVGGNTVDGPLDSVELYDPAMGTSREIGRLAAPRASHLALRMDDGRVLVFGGWSTEGATTSSEYFDPRTGTSERGPDMHVARISPRATALPDGSLVIVGRGSAERFDPQTGRFEVIVGPETNLPELPTALEDGTVLITGGYDVAEEQATPDPGGSHGDVRPATTRAVLLDPRVGSVTPVGPMHHARMLHNAVRLDDGRVLVAGGATDTHFDGEHVAETEIYDPASKTFMPASSTSGGRVWFTLNLLPPTCGPRGGCIMTSDVLLVGDNGGVPVAAEIYRP